MPQDRPKPAPLLTAEAARILNVTPAAVRVMERRGDLAAIRTVSGVRLFDSETVARFAEQRLARRRTV